MSLLVEFLGYAAAVVTTGAFAPQVWRSWRTGSVRDLSTAMLVSMASGNLMWLAYALAKGAAPLAAANAVTFLLVSALCAMKLREALAEPAPLAEPVLR